MGFSSLRCYQFRNLSDAVHQFSGREIFLIGENGQGKSNCLEALYLLCYGSSFRAHADADMIRNGHSEASVMGHYRSTEGNTQEISVIMKRKESKEIRVNGKKILERKDILLSIPCVVFSHDDLEFIIGSPAKKRRFLNQTLCLYNLRYLDLLKNYKRILHQRNSLLKQKRPDLLDIYNEQLSIFGFEIQEKRKELVFLFNKIVQHYFRRISGLSGTMEIVYHPSWQDCRSPASCREHLEKREGRDRVFRTTTSGPHRDQFFYYYNGADFSRIASTGQVRLLSIILRVAQASFFMEHTGRKPVLLLDDVLLELDSGKRELFIKSLPEYEQAFFTFLPDEDYIHYEKNLTVKYLVSGGGIQSWNERGKS